MDQTRQDAITFATALQQLYLDLLKQGDSPLAGSIEPLLPTLERYAPSKEVQAHLEAERKAQAEHQEMLSAQRRQKIEQFALLAPKFP